MSPLMLKQKEQQLKQELEEVIRLTTAPIRYIEYCHKHGTPLGKTYKLRKAA